MDNQDICPGWISANFRDHACFRDAWSGLDGFKLISVIVGRNNTGKSQLLQLVKELCKTSVSGNQWPVRLSRVLTEPELRPNFLSGHRGGDLSGDHWADHGRQLVNAQVTWTMLSNTARDASAILENGENCTDINALNRISGNGLLSGVGAPFSNFEFRHLLADRDLQPEAGSNLLSMDPNGEGATNLIRRFIVSSSLPQDLIKSKLLEGLNAIFSDDGHFTSIDVKQHDESKVKNNYWEIYLTEENKGQIALSESGSGLKTIILVLLNLLVVPKIPPAPSGAMKSKGFVYAFEELENNLHPSLLRRLAGYVEAHALRTGHPIFITTHSPVLIDVFGSAPHAQIVHVVHDGKRAIAKKITAHFDKYDAMSELGARPSDLLQANGVIWVEGPSDRIYVNKWIEISSSGSFREGIHYQCAFYGGSLIANYQFSDPEGEVHELANLLRINPNIALLCDSDRRADKAPIKRRVAKIAREVNQIKHSFSWITGVKEIENYLPGSSIAQAFGLPSLPDPGQYDQFFKSKSKKSSTKSYVEINLSRKRVDKVKLAVACAPYLSVDLMRQRFDWEAKISRLIEVIRRWNK